MDTPITLATLPQATMQQVFDQVATHLLTQGKQALMASSALLKAQMLGIEFVAATVCAYRGENGTKCAAGCLISDDEYVQHMEGNSWRELVEQGLVPGHLLTLIARLQSIHDHHFPEEWKDSLERTAKDFGLSAQVLN